MENLELIKKIVSDEELAEIASAVMAVNFLKEPKPLSEYNEEEFDGDYTFSENGVVFAECGSAFYILLDDGSIGYADPSYDECGRPAENMLEFLEFVLNTAYSWQNYMDKRFTDKPLVKSEIDACEKKGRGQYADAHGDEVPPYDDAAKTVAERLGLRIFEDITAEILPKLYKSMTREPQFTVTMDGGDPLHLVGKD